MAVFYKTYQDTRSTGNNMWYGRAAYVDTIDLEGVCERMCMFSTAFSEGKVKAVVHEMATIAAEELLASNGVKIDGVCILRAGIKCKPAPTEEDFTASTNIKDWHVNCMGSGSLYAKIMNQKGMVKKWPYTD